MRITCSDPLRTTRAKLGTVAMPIAIIAVSVLAPKTAPNMIASSSAGNASSRSLARITTSPNQRVAIAARMPSGTPITAATPTATNPTNSVVRAPTMIWLRTSRPNLSVPSQCCAEGVSSREVGSTSVGSYGVQTNETSAMATTSSTSRPPTTRLGLSRRPAPAPGAGVEHEGLGGAHCTPPRSRGSRAR